MDSYIAIVLDRSGSMSSIVDATIQGYNEFLTAQQKLPGTATFRSVIFDHEYEVVYNGPIQAAPALSRETFIPRGSTALLDAIGRTVNEIGLELSSMAESDRPKNVMVAVITDGEENASKEFTKPMVFDMISHQESKYSWTFLFLGAGKNAIADAQSMGFYQQNSMCYSATASSMSHVMRSVNLATTSVRSMGSYTGFTAEERDAAVT